MDSSLEMLDIKLNGQRIDELWAFDALLRLVTPLRHFEFNQYTSKDWKTFKVTYW